MKDKIIDNDCTDGVDSEDHADFVLDAMTIDDISHQNVQRIEAEPVTFQPVRKSSKVAPPTGASSGKERRRRLSQMNANRRHWWEAVMKIQTLSDPWEKFHLDDYPTEIAVRHRYNALCKTWVVDEVQVKMEPKPFNHGAMRECFRMRKLCKHTTNTTKWKTATNYVAKSYFDDLDRETYFEDVKLQMDAKLWGEEFNRHNPPKKVDIFQVSVLEILSREGKRWFHVEHFIEGNYIKYNSNSGYVNDEARFTPQAFSHFTFERSGHELIIVDIQGVGDLYTDPQIHTASGKEYGDGNLGTRGMALFFHSHECNVICEGLGLSSFDLNTSEIRSLNHHQTTVYNGATCIRGTEELCVLPSYYERTHLNEFLRSRSLSGGSIPADEIPSPRVRHLRTFSETSQGSNDDSDNDSGIGTLHQRQLSVQDSNVSNLPKEVDQKMFSNMIARRSRPSSVYHEIELRKLRENNRRRTGGSVLGQIHLELAKYHEAFRFTIDETYDKDAALFHLQHSADCDTLEAIINLGRMYLNFPHDVLVDIEVEETPENITKGIEYIQIAAEAGDKPSMIILAQAHDTGYNLGLKKQSWKEAVYWYNEAVATDDHDESGQYDGCIDDPKYKLFARLAELHRISGHDLAQNLEKSAELYQQAGDEAMLAMKGRLANMYYMLAEEVGCEME